MSLYDRQPVVAYHWRWTLPEIPAPIWEGLYRPSPIMFLHCSRYESPHRAGSCSYQCPWCYSIAFVRCVSSKPLMNHCWEHRLRFFHSDRLCAVWMMAMDADSPNQIHRLLHIMSRSTESGWTICQRNSIALVDSSDRFCAVWMMPLLQEPPLMNHCWEHRLRYYHSDRICAVWMKANSPNLSKFWPNHHQIHWLLHWMFRSMEADWTICQDGMTQLRFLLLIIENRNWYS